MSDFELVSGTIDFLFGVLFLGGIALVIWWAVRRSDRNARADIERSRGEVPWNERPLNDEAEAILAEKFPNERKRMRARRKVWRSLPMGETPTEPDSHEHADGMSAKGASTSLLTRMGEAVMFRRGVYDGMITDDDATWQSLVVTGGAAFLQAGSIGERLSSSIMFVAGLFVISVVIHMIAGWSNGTYMSVVRGIGFSAIPWGVAGLADTIAGGVDEVAWIISLAALAYSASMQVHCVRETHHVATWRAVLAVVTPYIAGIGLTLLVLAAALQTAMGV